MIDLQSQSQGGYLQQHSPLFMVMNNPVLHRFISYLAEKKTELEENGGSPIKIELSRSFIDSVRESFRQNILDGERHLHMLAHRLASELLGGEFELHSNVIGVLPDEERPFLIRERINRQTLFSEMDIDLGNHLLDNFRYQKERAWVPLELSANFVEYIPQGQPNNGVNRLTSRVKAEEELWNKVADELFHVDQLLSRDKHLRQYSKYVKDIFGIKIVCEDESACNAVHKQVAALSFKPEDWSQFGVAQAISCTTGKPENGKLLEYVETKDYLNCQPSAMKKTGWKALKSVVRWHDRLFELQVQPLGNYYLELDHMSGPSHRSFKLSRDSMRDELARRLPLYGFYRDLLRVLFMGEDASYEYENATVAIT